MASEQDELEQIVEHLRQSPGLAEQLPMEQKDIVRDALAGNTINDIAANNSVAPGYVWEVLSNAARMATGRTPTQRTEVGGLGSDTDPGVTGGYGETAFGSIGNEPPYPTPEEPDESGEMRGEDNE